jgi:long-subunit fatty acid transport protein
MKKAIFTIFSFILIAQLSFAGGIVTNTNQSAAWIRMMARDASVDVDAVFFNPAGLTQLEDGFYLQINSQTVKQTRTVTSTFPGLNNDTYEGNTSVPFLPTAFAVYKKGNLAVSAGFTVIGGGGSAEFDKGLPEFEYKLAGLPTTLAGLKDIGDKAGVDLSVTGYDVNSSITGTSSYFGIQAAASYKINDMISVAVGARYVLANNKYDGYLKDISVVNGGQTIRADDFINQKAVPTLNGLSSQLTQITQIPTLLQPYIDGGFGGVTLAQAKAAGAVDDDTYNALIQAGQAIGISDPSALTVEQFSGAITQATPALNAQIAQLDGTAAALSASANDLADKKIDVEQSGSGITPFFGVDFNLMDGNLGLALKYEMKTNMNVTTTVTKDDLGIFKDGEEVPAEMPAMFSAGLRYKMGGLKLQTGFHYYFDKDAKYGKRNANGEFVTNGEEVNINGDKTYLEGNSTEFAIGLQYDINSMFGVSAGFLMTKSNPNSIYQSSLSYTLPTKTVGFGFVIHPISKLDIDLGVSSTSYDEYEKDFGTFKETYDKTALVFALGATLKL